MDVGAWLRSLGLGQYEAAFRDNEIDGAVLPKLTVEDLRDLGVAVIGHRRKIISAIEELNAASAARAEGVNAVPTQRLPVGASSDAAERRPITVMFCDLVGSTSLAARLDAEDWRNLVGAYLDAASQAVTGFGGHVLKRLGDGLMALFGYPKAQENDAERAVRAALAIQRALAELNARNAGQGRRSSSPASALIPGRSWSTPSGEVFGDAPMSPRACRPRPSRGPSSSPRPCSGRPRGFSSPRIAARMSSRACRSRSRSIASCARAAAAGAAARARSRRSSDARRSSTFSAAAGSARAKGEGQLALSSASPGIGKSRLIEEFHARLAETPHTWVEWSSSQLLQNTPLHPIAEWGRLRFGADLPAEQRLADLESTSGADRPRRSRICAPARAAGRRSAA